MGSSAHFGHRVYELRKLRGSLTNELGISRGYLSKIEKEHQGASLGCIEGICERLNVGLNRFFASQGKFDSMLLIEDRFVQLVLPYLKRLSVRQKEEVLKVLKIASGRP